MRIIEPTDLTGLELQHPNILLDESILYTFDSGNKVAKVFPRDVLADHSEELEERLSNPTHIEGVVMPEDIIYSNGKFVGYTMERINGENDSKHEKKLDFKTKRDLYRIAKKYLKLEKIVREAPEGVVFPNLLDRSCLLIDKNDDIHIANYDKIQIGNHSSYGSSSNLGNFTGEFSKYNKDGIYSKELDIRSLTIYYFLLALGANLGKGFLGNTEEDLHKYYNHLCNLGITNPRIQDKIFSLFDPNTKNEYLGEDVLWIAENCTVTQYAGKKYFLHKRD
jgi:hypothetical protein